MNEITNYNAKVIQKERQDAKRTRNTYIQARKGFLRD